METDLYYISINKYLYYFFLHKEPFPNYTIFSRNISSFTTNIFGLYTSFLECTYIVHQRGGKI